MLQHLCLVFYELVVFYLQLINMNEWQTITVHTGFLLPPEVESFVTDPVDPLAFELCK